MHLYNHKLDSDDHEVPYDLLTNLVLIGKGAEGEVFKGELNGTTVAVKKVLTIEDTDISHFLSLSHENLVQFLLVLYVVYATFL